MLLSAWRPQGMYHVTISPAKSKEYLVIKQHRVVEIIKSAFICELKLCRKVGLPWVCLQIARWN